MRGHYYWNALIHSIESLSHKLLKLYLSHKLLKQSHTNYWNACTHYWKPRGFQLNRKVRKTNSLFQYTTNTTPMSTLALEVTIQTLLQGSNSLSRHPGHAKLHHVSCTYNLERRLSDSTSAINAAGMGKFLSWREGKRDSKWLSSTSTLAAFEFWWSLPGLIYFT